MAGDAMGEVFGRGIDGIGGAFGGGGAVGERCGGGGSGDCFVAVVV